MKKVIDRWYISLIVIPTLLTYLTNYYTLPKLFSDWKVSAIFTLIMLAVILLIELKIKNEEVVKLKNTPNPSDLKAIKRLFKKLDVNAFEEDICNADAWNGYKQNSVNNITAYQYASRLTKNEILDSEIRLAFSNFNYQLEKFTDFTRYHVSGHPAGFLVPFKDVNQEKARADSDIMNELSSNAHTAFKKLLILLKAKNYL